MSKRKSSYGVKQCAYCGSRKHYTQHCPLIKQDKKQILEQNRIYRRTLIETIEKVCLFPASTIRTSSKPFPHIGFESNFHYDTLWMVKDLKLHNEYIQYIDIEDYKLAKTRHYKRLKKKRGRNFEFMYVGSSSNVNSCGTVKLFTPHSSVETVPFSLTPSLVSDHQIDGYNFISYAQDGKNIDTIDGLDLNDFLYTLPISSTVRGDSISLHDSVQTIERTLSRLKKASVSPDRETFQIQFMLLDSFRDMYKKIYGPSVYQYMVYSVFTMMFIMMNDYKPYSNAIRTVEREFHHDYLKHVSKSKTHIDSVLPFSVKINSYENDQGRTIDSINYPNLGTVSIDEWVNLTKYDEDMIWKNFLSGFNTHVKNSK